LNLKHCLEVTRPNILTRFLIISN